MTDTTIRRFTDEREHTEETEDEEEHVCPECGGDLVADGERGETVCEDCGLVVEEDEATHPACMRSSCALTNFVVLLVHNFKRGSTAAGRGAGRAAASPAPVQEPQPPLDAPVQQHQQQQQSALSLFASVKDEYDPMRPNDYEEVSTRPYFVIMGGESAYGPMACHQGAWLRHSVCRRSASSSVFTLCRCSKNVSDLSLRLKWRQSA